MRLLQEKNGNQHGTNELVNMRRIQRAVRMEHYEISRHAERERLNDNLTINDLEEAIASGEVIESYPNDPRGSSCLVCGFTSGGISVHLVVGFLPGGWVRIITVYVPDPDEWEPDWKTRKRRK